MTCGRVDAAIVLGGPVEQAFAADREWRFGMAGIVGNALGFDLPRTSAEMGELMSTLSLRPLLDEDANAPMLVVNGTQEALCGGWIDGRWERAYAGQAEVEVPADLAQAIAASPVATERFAALTRAERDPPAAHRAERGDPGEPDREADRALGGRSEVLLSPRGTPGGGGATPGTALAAGALRPERAAGPAGQ